MQHDVLLGASFQVILLIGQIIIEIYWKKILMINDIVAMESCCLGVVVAAVAGAVAVAVADAAVAVVVVVLMLLVLM